MSDFPVLTLLTLAPLIAGVIVAGLAPHRKGLARGLALLVAFGALALTLCLWRGFDASSGELQFEEAREWIPTLNIGYHLGLDGLGLLMVLLTAILVPLALLASWQIQERVPLFQALVLFLQAGLFGTFTAQNFFHWFLFWELSLIPAFFLIKLWGGPQRKEAATQFFIYTMVGSVTLLLSFMALYLATGQLEFADLAEWGRKGTLASALEVKLGWHFLSKTAIGLVIFAGALLGFAVKVPLIPFHTWLPTTYAEAPTGVTMLLTGAMSKMGVYGFLRILLPIFPEQMRAVLTPLLWLAVITIVWSAAAAFAQRDLKRILAYSSINHLGYCLLAVFAVARFMPNESAATADKAAALNGVMLQMFNHGLTAATLFWFVALLEKRTAGIRGISDFGGLRSIIPIFCGFMGIALFSSLGLPGLNGFVGEFLIFRGAFPLVTWAAAISSLGLLLTAVFLLTLLQRVFTGPLNEKWSAMPDLSPGEIILLSPALALMFLLGLYPQLILRFIDATSLEIIRGLRF